MYTGGTIAMIVCYVVAIICILAYGLLCTWENRKRLGAAEGEVAAEQDWLDLTDKQKEGFRYTT